MGGLPCGSCCCGCWAALPDCMFPGARRGGGNSYVSPASIAAMRRCAGSAQPERSTVRITTSSSWPHQHTGRVHCTPREYWVSPMPHLHAPLLAWRLQTRLSSAALVATCWALELAGTAAESLKRLIRNLSAFWLLFPTHRDHLCGKHCGKGGPSGHRGCSQRAQEQKSTRFMTKQHINTSSPLDMAVMKCVPPQASL